MSPQSVSKPSKEHKLNSESDDQLVQEFSKEEDHSLPVITNKGPLSMKIVTGTEIDMLYVLLNSSLPTFILKPNSYHSKQPLCDYHFYRDTAKDPTYWSKVCLYYMVKLAREGTTLRRVLEPLFHHFDTQNQWSSEKGVAARILMYLLSLLEESGSPNSVNNFPKKVKSLSNFSVIDCLLHTRR